MFVAICAGSKTIDLEVLGDVKERDAFAWAFDKIIGEAGDAHLRRQGRRAGRAVGAEETGCG